MVRERSLKDCVEIVQYFESLESQGLTFCNHDTRSRSTLRKEKRHFVLDTDEQLNNTSFDDSNINGKEYSVNESSGIKILDSHIKSTNYFDSTSFRVYRFRSISNESTSNTYHRLVMSQEKSNFRVDHYFENILSVATDIKSSPLNAFEIDFENFSFIVYITDEYYVIETDDKIDSKIFLEYCRYALTSFSFIVGYSPGGYAFIFSYSDVNYTNLISYEFNSSFIQSVDNLSYAHISSNVYTYCQDLPQDKREAFVKKYRDDFRGVNKKTLSFFCNELINNSAFSDGVHSITQARESSLISMGVLYSVSLESLSNLISKSEEDNLFHIDSKIDRKRLQKELTKVAREIMEDELDITYDPSPIKARIDNINAPTNKDKLFIPFDHLNIPLEYCDEDIINKRNSFLHGNVLYDHNNDFDVEYRKLWCIALRLSFLVNAIVLKYVGHSGKIKNPVGLLVKEYKQPTYRNI